MSSVKTAVMTIWNGNSGTPPPLEADVPVQVVTPPLVDEYVELVEPVVPCGELLDDNSTLAS